MKWKVLKLFIPLLLLAFVVPMILPGPDGQAIMHPTDLLPDTGSIQGAMDTLKASVVVPAAQPARVYQWQDEQGLWHFTNDPAQAPADAEMLLVDEVVNTLPAPKAGAGGATTDTPALPDYRDLGSMVDDAEQVKVLSQQRLDDLEAL